MEWVINAVVLHQIFQIWGKPLVDLFTSYQNRKLEIFCSWKAHPQALAIDNTVVLEHVKQAQCKLILIASQWLRRHWYTALPQMCIAQTIGLPLRQDPLRQPRTIIYHPNQAMFNLNAWLLSTNSLDQKV